MNRDTDAKINQLFHNAIKRARAITDDTLRAALLADLIELERLHGVRLAEAHDERLLRAAYERELRKP